MDSLSSNQQFSVLPSSFMSGSPLSLGLPIRPLKLALSISQGYDTNVNSTNTNVVSGWFTSFVGHATYNFGGPRLKLSAGLDGGIAYYPTISTNQIQPNGDIYLNATYKATPRLTLGTTNLLAYYYQPQLGVQGVAANSSQYFSFNDTMQATYQWSQVFSTVTGYALNSIYYTGVSQADQMGYVSQTISQSANWLILPKTTFVLQYMATPITYFEASQNSLSNYAVVGVNQLFSTRAYESFRIGAEVTTYENGGSGTQTTINPYMQSTFNYNIGRTSTVSWNMTYGTQPSGLSDVTLRQSFTTSIYWTQAVTGRLTATFGMNYQNNYYSQSALVPSGSQNVVGFNAGLNFALNRIVSLSAGYNFYDSIGASDISTPYVRSQIFCGANFAF